MKTDLYTKAVLTVIAISLSAIAVQHTIPNAFAQQNTQPIKVMICDPNPNWYNSYGYNSSAVTSIIAQRLMVSLLRCAQIK